MYQFQLLLISLWKQLCS